MVAFSSQQPLVCGMLPLGMHFIATATAVGITTMATAAVWVLLLATAAHGYNNGLALKPALGYTPTRAHTLSLCLCDSGGVVVAPIPYRWNTWCTLSDCTNGDNR
jgi:hypothetical protein